MGEIPAGEGARVVGGGGQSVDREDLAGREIDASEEHERKGRTVLADRGLEVLDAQGVLPGARLHRDEVGRRIEPAIGEMAHQRVPVGREERHIHEDPSPRTARSEEGCEQQLDVDGQRVEDRHLVPPRPDDPGHAVAKPVVESEPLRRVGEHALDAEVRPRVELRLDGRADIA